MNAVTKQVQTTNENRGVGPNERTSSPTQRVVRTSAGSGLRGSATPRQSIMPTQLSTERCTNNPNSSTHVRSRVGESNRQQNVDRRYVQYGERSPMYVGSQRPRVGEKNIERLQVQQIWAVAKGIHTHLLKYVRYCSFMIFFLSFSTRSALL